MAIGDLRAGRRLGRDRHAHPGEASTATSIVLNGTKRWISNGGHADHYLVYCRLSDEPGAKGIGAIIVARPTRPGVSFGAQERLMGFRGIPSARTSTSTTSGCPSDNLVVPAGGFRKLFSVFSIERLGNATMSLAIGQAVAGPHRSPTCRSASSSAGRSSSSRTCR